MKQKRPLVSWLLLIRIRQILITIICFDNVRHQDPLWQKITSLHHFTYN